MSTTKAAHTPGPWSTRGCRDGSGDIGITADGLPNVLAECFAAIRHRDECSTDECAANAALIAAAPELLAALKYFIAETDDNDADYEPRTSPHAVARAAISKATGQGGVI